MERVRTPSISEWQELSCNTFVPVRCRTDDPSEFSASLRSVRLDKRIDLSEITSSSLRVERRADEARAYRGDEILFMIQLESRSAVSQAGRTAYLMPGSAVLYDPRTPYVLDFADTAQALLVFSVSRRALGVADHRIGHMTARPIHRSTPGLSSLVGLARGAFNEESPPGGLASTFEHLIFLSAGYAEGTAYRSEIGRIREEAMRFIRANLSDESLSVAHVAAALHVSQRRLYSAFEHFRESPAKRMREERIGQARRLLRETSMSVAEVGAACGYRDPSVFSRAFSRHEGCPPRAYRVPVS
ncbi:AraC family transcriptional regulator [Microbacterium sp. LWO13-1.2]|uniref:AraC family transcriptional regulator n=1 Tax=Microbacterium sp. LWO13-1.2 TaxID=3135262 RepID=UPI003139C7AC